MYHSVWCLHCCGLYISKLRFLQCCIMLKLNRFVCFFLLPVHGEHQISPQRFDQTRWLTLSHRFNCPSILRFHYRGSFHGFVTLGLLFLSSWNRMYCDHLFNMTSFSIRILSNVIFWFYFYAPSLYVCVWLPTRNVFYSIVHAFAVLFLHLLYFFTLFIPLLNRIISFYMYM